MSKLALFGGSPVRRTPYPQWPIYNEKEKSLILEVLESKKWSRSFGDKNIVFETNFSRFQKVKYTTAVCNGSVALRIALFAAGIGPGDEVIIPSYTFISTATTVIEANAIPVFADINLDTMNISPESIENLITNRTKAIIPVYFGGAITDMDKIRKIARKYSLTIIEDAAQAQGSIYKNKTAGNLGDIATFSFQESKNMTSGEGGAIVTNKKKLHEKVRLFYNCGRKKEYPWYYHFEISSNYRLSEFQAAILIAQLEREKENLKIRQENAKILDKILGEIEGIKPITYPDKIKSSYYLYIFKLSEEVFNGISKGTFTKAMQAEGIPIMEGYPFPLYKQSLFKKKRFWKYNCPFSCKFYKGDFKKHYNPNSEKACKTALWIPNFVLHSDKKGIEQIGEAIIKIKKNLNRLRKND